MQPDPNRASHDPGGATTRDRAVRRALPSVIALTGALLGLVAFALNLAACEEAAGESTVHPALHHAPSHPSTQPASVATDVVLAPAPALSEGQFPCSDCHEPDLPVRTKKRKLEKAHQEIALAHGGEQLWCFDCHDVKERDQLRTAGGQLIPLGDAHLLCGQCHGRELRDWSSGAHGLRTGSWSGTKTALRCASCHDAHAPHFKPLKPVPPPRKPKRTP